MIGNASSGKEQQEKKASAASGKGSGAIAFHPPAQMKNEPSQETEMPLSTSGEAVTPFRAAPADAIQRVPNNDPPGNDGMHWDTFNAVDHNGTNVPGEVIGVMRNPGNGGAPSVSPPGWNWLKSKFGRLKGSWVRFHIINAELGGPGNDPDNLVPTTHATNHNAGWRNLEDAAKNTATDDDDNTLSQWTYLEVDLNYDDNFPTGIPETIRAERGIHDGTSWVRQGGTVNLQQANPDDGEDTGFLPGTQITKTSLREDYGLSNAEANTIKDLIDATWDDQDALDEAVEQQESDEPSDAWYGVINRMYVAEDDGDGPYPVAFKTT